MKKIIANKRGASVTLFIALAAGLLLAIMAAGLLSPKPAEASDPPVVPDSVIVHLDGLDWVWASPCAQNGCSTINVGLDGFIFATPAQWDLRPPITEFMNPLKCASQYFDARYRHCDQGDLFGGFYGSAPAGELPAGVDGDTPMHRNGDT